MHRNQFSWFKLKFIIFRYCLFYSGLNIQAKACSKIDTEIRPLAPFSNIRLLWKMLSTWVGKDHQWNGKRVASSVHCSIAHLSSALHNLSGHYKPPTQTLCVNGEDAGVIEAQCQQTHSDYCRSVRKGRLREQEANRTSSSTYFRWSAELSPSDTLWANGHWRMSCHEWRWR